MLNKTIQMGRFVRDPELRSTATGKSVTSFTLAVGRDYKEPDGTRKADFINYVAWGNTAEFICRNFKKGSMAVVEGALQTRPYEESDGKKRTATEVNVNNIYFGDSKKETSESVPEVPPASSYGYDDDLPF